MKRDLDVNNFVIKPKHDRLLATLAMLSLATTDQLNRALYAVGSLTTTEHLLNQLYQQRYLDRINWRRFDKGNPKTVWKLAARGMRYLKRRDLAPVGLIRPSNNTTHTRSQLTHTMRSTDLLVHALELQKTDPSFELAYASEPTLRRHPLVVGSGLNEVTIYPDGFVRITKHRELLPPGEAALAFELTRTTDVERIKVKLQAWLQADQGPEYEQLFGTPLLIVVWVIDALGRARRDLLARACWQLLTDVHQEERADLFVFGIDGDDFFFNENLFVQPGPEPIPVSLLPQTWRLS